MAQAETALHSRTSHAKVLPKLRHLGIYELPDNRRYVASMLFRGGIALHHIHTWSWYGNAEYWVNNDGQVLSHGVPTGWSAMDLKDTGETASYPKPKIL
jgi:hypothetical protein